jgi:hypothetical protein
MKRLALFCAALLALVYFAPEATAGENKYLGTILLDGGLTGTNNSSTQTPFAIPPGSQVTVYCGDVTYYLADSTTVADGGSTVKGVPIPGTTLFPTSVGARLMTIGGQPSGLLAFFGTTSCDVWLRSGTE